MTQSTGSYEASVPPNLVDADTFHLMLHLELQKAMRLRYCVSVVAVSVDVRNGATGEEVDPGLARHLAEVATRRLRSTDVVTTLSRTCIGLMLIDAEAPVLSLVINRAVQHWDSAPVVLSGRPWPIRWSAGAASYPHTASTATGLLGQATELMARARVNGARRVYLPH